ncbi:MAG: protein O-mannosyl-transferase family, partial [Bradymonadia bacterium]
MSTTPVKSDQDFERKITVTQRSIQMNSSECFAFFGICLAIFTVFLAPSITSNDAGELGAAAFELGIAHPPGFPVFSMLVNGIMNLLGLGDFGFRGNFSSAVFGAAALSITFYTLRSRGIGMMEAWTFGLLTVFAPLFTVHMVTVEVYASAALTVSVSIELLLRYLERDDVRFLFLLALVLGIGGLGHHPMIRLVGICFAFFVLPKSKLKLGITVFGVSLFTGLLTLMYLPIRSNAHPNRDWGSPRTIDGLLDHVMGQRIRDSYADQMLAWDPEVFSSFASQLFTSSTVLLLFAVGSLAFTLREPLIKVFLALLALDIFYTVWINPMGVRDHQNGWLTTLMLFPIACLGFRRLKAQSHRLSSLVILLLVPTTVWSAATYASHEEFSSTNPWAKTLTKTMGRLAPESLILSASDSACSVLSFLQVTEANRPDIAVIVRQHAFRASSTEPTFKRLPVALSGWKPGASLTDLVHLSDEWPLAWEWIDGLDANIKPKTNVMIGPFMGRAQLSAPLDRRQWQTGVSNGLWSQRPNF